MELTKATEILIALHNLNVNGLSPSEKHAIKLGSEALTYILRLRACSIQHRQNRLPSEDSFIDTTRSEHAIKRILESPLGREPKG